MNTANTAAADWVLILPVVLPLLGAAVLLMLSRLRDFHWLFAAAVVTAVLLLDIDLFRRTLAAAPVSMTMGNWLPPFGISFTADAMSAGFASAAAAVTLLILIYVQAGPRADRPRGLYSLMLLLLAGVSGALLTGDLFNLYVWFEVMLIASFGLMALGGGRLQIDGTVKYGFINFLATTFFLLALGLLYGLLGTLNMADVLGAAARANPAAMAGVAALLLLAFGIKAAAFPVHVWLPASYHTPPAAVSALLAGLLTKVGVYALLRTLVMLLPASRDVLEPVLAVVAAVTLLLAPLGAIAETNLRRALGFLVIGGIGAVMLGIAMPNENGVSGAAIYIVHAMLTMTGLYLVAGLIERATGTTDTRLMGGLYAANAPMSVVFLVLVLAVSGVPPFLGFWPKLLLLEGGLDAAGLAAGAEIAWIPAGLALTLLLNALLTLIAGTRLWAHVFWRPGPEGERSEMPNPRLKRPARRESWLGLGATALLTAMVLVLGLLPNLLLEIGRS
ncbi:MAG TPA: Na+/H+ antiporter subunit D, partial [Alphaproteobacteria bacterium]|nr:Na+/H+ antiporter subunit D [Alphaproteobacteria bacterium]